MAEAVCAATLAGRCNPVVVVLLMAHGVTVSSLVVIATERMIDSINTGIILLSFNNYLSLLTIISYLSSCFAHSWLSPHFVHR